MEPAIHSRNWNVKSKNGRVWDGAVRSAEQLYLDSFTLNVTRCIQQNVIYYSIVCTRSRYVYYSMLRIISSLLRMSLANCLLISPEIADRVVNPHSKLRTEMLNIWHLLNAQLTKHRTFPELLMKIALCGPSGSTSLEFRDTIQTFHITHYATESIPCSPYCSMLSIFSTCCSTVRILSQCWGAVGSKS